MSVQSGQIQAPVDGAQSFKDYDEYCRKEQESASIELPEAFATIVYNIFSDESLSLALKAEKIEDAARIFKQRASGESSQGGILRSLVRMLKAKPAEIPAPEPAPEPVATTGSFRVYKDADGKLRWLGSYSNQFEDREGEILSASAHREFIEYADHTKDYPELWLWHVPGSRIGKADILDFADGLAIASGTFDKEYEYVAQNLSEMGDLAMSHGFACMESDFANGVYSRYRTREVSVLPRKNAANAITFFMPEKEYEHKAMMTPEKEAMLARALGPDKAKDFSNMLQAVGQKALASGLNFKEFSEAIVEAAAPEPATPEPVETKEAPPAAAAVDLAPVMSLLEGIKAQLDEHGKEIAALKATDEEKIVSILTPRNDPRRGGYQASVQGTEVSPDDPRVKAFAEADAGRTPRHLQQHMAAFNALLSGSDGRSFDAASL